MGGTFRRNPRHKEILLEATQGPVGALCEKAVEAVGPTITRRSGRLADSLRVEERDWGYQILLGSKDQNPHKAPVYEFGTRRHPEGNRPLERAAILIEAAK